MNVLKKLLTIAMVFGLTMVNSGAAGYDIIINIDSNNDNSSDIELHDGTAAGGTTWSWDGVDTITLNGYNGGYIYINGTTSGNINIKLEGTNSIENVTDVNHSCIQCHGKNLIISGDGSLSLSYTNAGANQYGIFIGGGDLTINGTTLSAQGSTGIYANKGKIKIINSNVELKGTEEAVMAFDDGSDISITGTIEEPADGKVMDVSRKTGSGGKTFLLKTIGPADILMEAGESLDKSTFAKIVKISKEIPETEKAETVTTPKAVGRTCQDDGYPAGYEWSDEKQACILENSSTAAAGRFAVVNTADK